MKKKLAILYGAIVLLLLASCKYDPSIANPEDYASVYMPQAESVKEYIFRQSVGRDQIVVGASYGGVDEAPDDIYIKFEVDQSLVDQYNEINNTELQHIPSANISFPAQEAIIKKGELQSTTLPIDIDFTGLRTFTSYLLPVKIASSTGNVPIKEELHITYFRLEVRSDPTRVKVMSVGKRTSHQRMDLVASTITKQEPDIALIREMDKSTDRSQGIDTPEELFGLLSDYSHYQFVNGWNAPYFQRPGGEYGFAVYSKYPISNVVMHKLENTGYDDYAPLGIMELEIQGNTVIFAATHLVSHAGRRELQVRTLVEKIQEYVLADEGRADFPVILAGNMNANPMIGPNDDTYAVLSLPPLGLTPVCSACPTSHPDPNFNGWTDMILASSNTRYTLIDYSIGEHDWDGGWHPIMSTLDIFF